MDFLMEQISILALISFFSSLHKSLKRSKTWPSKNAFKFEIFHNIKISCYMMVKLVYVTRFVKRHL